jgi:hypothetical protein
LCCAAIREFTYFPHSEMADIFIRIADVCRRLSMMIGSIFGELLVVDAQP